MGQDHVFTSLQVQLPLQQDSKWHLQKPGRDHLLQNPFTQACDPPISALVIVLVKETAELGLRLGG